jgi:hypothetical protein
MRQKYLLPEPIPQLAGLFRKALETACPAGLIKIIENGYTILAVFAKLREASISIVTSYLPSVHIEQLGSH